MGTQNSPGFFHVKSIVIREGGKALISSIVGMSDFLLRRLGPNSDNAVSGALSRQRGSKTRRRYPFRISPATLLLDQDDCFPVSCNSGTIPDVSGSATTPFYRNHRSRPAICTSGGSLARDGTLAQTLGTSAAVRCQLSNTESKEQ
jgi:hypothetical protein